METIDVYVGGKKCDSVSEKQLFGYVIGLCMPHLKYMSKEAILDWINETCNLMEEVLTWGKNPVLKRRIGYTREYLLKKGESLNRNMLMNIVSNIILSDQGMGTLSGFGYSKDKSAYSINPEITSIRNI